MAEAKLMVELIGKVDKFSADMEKAKKSIESVEKSIDSVSKSAKVIKLDSLINLGERALRATERMYDFAKSVSSAANDIERQSKLIGVSSEAFQQWQYAAKMADVSNESLNTGLKFLARNMEEASQGTGDAAKWFQAMGISVKDASGNLRPLDQMMGQVADKFASWEDGPRKIAISMALFGRSGQDLVPLMNQGAAGIQKYMQEVKKLGGVLSDDLLQAGSKVEDQFKRLETKFDALKMKLGLPFAESFVNEITKMVDAVESFAAAIKKSPLTSWLFTPITGESRLTSIEKEIARADRMQSEMGGQYLGGKTTKPPPTIDKDGIKWGEKEIQKIEEEIRQLEAQLQYGSHYGANIGTSEGEGLVSGMMVITTEDIERWDRVYDSMGKVIGLQPIYRQELIKIADAVKQVEAEEKARIEAEKKLVEEYDYLTAAEVSAYKEEKEYDDTVFKKRKEAFNEMVLEIEKASMAIATMTGDIEGQEQIYEDILDKELERIENIQGLTDAEKELLAMLIQEVAVQEKLTRERERQGVKYGVQKELGEITGDMALQKSAELALIELEGQRLKQLGVEADLVDQITKARREEVYFRERWKILGNVGQGMQDAFSTAFSTMIKDIHSFEDAFKSMAKRIGDMFIDTVADMAANFLIFGNLVGGKGGTSFGGKAGGFGGIVGMLGSLFGLKEGGILPGNFIPIKAFAGGGTAYGPTFGMVGEAGPEAVVPLKHGKIPVESKGGGNTYIYISAMDSQSMEDALRRNPNTIMKIVRSNAENAGPMRGIMRSYL